MGQLIKNGISYTGATGIIDNVGSSSPSLALSANQGNKLASNMGAIELTDSASRAYATNDYFVWKSQFVRATKAISAGDTILISGSGANVESTNIGSVLNTINEYMKLTDITSQITFDETHFDVNKNFSKVYRCGYIVNVCFWGSIKTRYGGSLYPVGNLPVPVFTQRYELLQNVYESSTSSSLDGVYSEIDYLGRLAVITNNDKIFGEGKLICCTYTYLAESL